MSKKELKITKYCNECGTGAIINSTICTSCGAELMTSKGMQFVQPIRSKQDIEKMKSYLKSKNIRDWVLFTLGINSALRISDLLKITVSEVIDDNGNIRDRLRLKETKTGKSKDFPFSNKVRDALKEYISIANPTEFLFPSKKGGAIQRTYANKILSDAAKAIGIKENIGSHSMRKTWSYQAYKEGVSLAQISDALNHSTEKMTRKYLGLTQESLDNVFMSMDL